MARAKSGVVTRRRRKKILKLAKGYFGSKRVLFRTAHEQVMRSFMYAYRDRRRKKRDFRRLWITRINAAARQCDLSYSRLMHGLAQANIAINRKMLAELAVHDFATFQTLSQEAKQALVQTTTKESRAVDRAEDIKPSIKESEQAKKPSDTDRSIAQEVTPIEAEAGDAMPSDLSKLTVAQLREEAKKRHIKIPSGLRKAELITFLSKQL